MVQVTPVQGDFVAVVDNVDLAYPLNDDEFAAVEMAFETYGVIVFPAQDITDDQQIAFSRRFGPWNHLFAATGTAPSVMFSCPIFLMSGRMGRSWLRNRRRCPTIEAINSGIPTLHLRKSRQKPAPVGPGSAAKRWRDRIRRHAGRLGHPLGRKAG